MIELNSKNTSKIYLYDQEMVEEEFDGTNISIKNTLKVYLHNQEMVEEGFDGTNISINPSKRGTIGRRG